MRNCTRGVMRAVVWCYGKEPMSVLRNIIVFHSRRSTPAKPFDISRLLDMGLHKRMFMLKDRNLPFELHIRYALQRPSTTVNAVYQYDTWFAMRYRSERDAVADMIEIEDKQRRLVEILERLAEESER